MLGTLIKRHSLYLYTLLSGLLLFFVVFVWNKSEHSGKYNILLIHSFDKSYVWMDDFERGLRDGLKKSKTKANVQRYYWKPEYNTNHKLKFSAMTGWLDQFVANPPDLIITCDDRATLTFLQTGHSLTKQVPVVFTGVDCVDYDLLKGHTNVTGFTDDPDYIRCYHLARQLYGKITDITVIAESDSNLGQVPVEDLRYQFSQLPNLVEIIETFPTYTVDTMTTARAAANPFKLHIERLERLMGRDLKQVLFYRLNSVCILSKWDETYEVMARLGTAPFLMVNNEGFGGGWLGGYMALGYDQMYNAMMAGARILKGTPVQDIPITPSKQYPVFDWRQLQYWKINLDALPEDSQVLNIPFYVKYQQSLVAVGIIGTLFLLLFFWLLIRLYRRESYNKVAVQKRLRKEQRELDITMDALSEGVVSFTIEGTVLSVNRAAIDILGLEKRKSYIGVSVASLFDVQLRDDPSYLTNLLHSFADSVNKSEKLHDAAYFITPRKEFPVSGNICSLDYDGKSYGVLISFRDVTNEYTQKQSLALSMASGNLFAWKFDQEQQAFLFEEVFFDTFQLPHDDTLLIAKERFLQAVHPEDQPEVRRLMEEMITSLAVNTSIVCRLRYNGQGDYQWWKSYISLYPTPMRSDQYQYYGIWANMDEFKKREEEFTRLRDEAEKSDRLKTVFLSNMSHEVRTPLNSIVGFSSILIDNQDLAWEDRKEFIDIINDNCRLLLELINEILDISRIESGIYFREEPCNLTEVAREAIAMHETGRPATIEVNLDTPEEPYIMLGDDYRLIQLFSHLLSNAYKFTPKGNVTVGYWVNDEKNEVCLFVKDTGKGITVEERDKIFNRFYKSDEFVQGGGLGLSIVAEIVKRLKGRVVLDSEVGKGSVFTICLPVHTDVVNQQQNA